MAVMWRTLQQHGQIRIPQPSTLHNLEQIQGVQVGSRAARGGGPLSAKWSS